MLISIIVKLMIYLICDSSFSLAPRFKYDNQIGAQFIKLKKTLQLKNLHTQKKN